MKIAVIVLSILLAVSVASASSACIISPGKRKRRSTASFSPTQTRGKPSLPSIICAKLRHCPRAKGLKSASWIPTTTFIHSPNPHNILPDGLFAVGDVAYNGREADLHVCHYDYNVLMLRHYVQYQKRKEAASSGDEIPFFSISSTSPITAGLVALLKGANGRLTPSACKRILIETGKQVMFGGVKCVRVPDAYEAVKLALDPRYQ